MSESKGRTPIDDLESDFGMAPSVVSMSLRLGGNVTDGDGKPHLIIVLFGGSTLLERPWTDGTTLELKVPIDLDDNAGRSTAVDTPLILLLRAMGSKAKEPDPTLNPDNRAAATVDLLPFVLGESYIDISVELLRPSGERSGCSVEVRATSEVGPDERTVLTVTVLEARCLPAAKDGTVYMALVGLGGIATPHSNLNFGLSLSGPNREKTLWPVCSALGCGGQSAVNTPDDDVFLSKELTPESSDNCISCYWYAMKRVMVDIAELRARVSRPFLVEVVATSRGPKVENRGYYSTFVDCRVLLERGQLGVTVAAPLNYFNEMDVLDFGGPLMSLPPTSAKSIRNVGPVFDENHHPTHILIRFDLNDALVAKSRMASLFDTIGYPTDEAPHAEKPPKPEDSRLDVRKIRMECGALNVHNELINHVNTGFALAASTKHSAANKLLTRIKQLLKQFPPGDISNLSWQDVVTAQHEACRRAVLSSFTPQPPPEHPPTLLSGTQAKVSGDTRVSDLYNDMLFQNNPSDSRILMTKALRCLEVRSDEEARTYLLKALERSTRNKYLLWLFGAFEFDKGHEANEKASAAFRIAVKGDKSDGTVNAIGWAALLGLFYYNDQEHAAFVAAKKMRKSHELPRNWKGFLQRWEKSSCEVERFWNPYLISPSSPLLLAAAFFLCLRSYKFSEILLQCYEQELGSRGSRLGLMSPKCPDVPYIRAASLLLRRRPDDALALTNEAIAKFGPYYGMLAEIRLSCLYCKKQWGEVCETALAEAEAAGSGLCPALLVPAALSLMASDPSAALQRAARAHKALRCGYSALAVGRAYAQLKYERLAARWAAAAVQLEPRLADGWAFLAVLALRRRAAAEARALLRTAQQAGPVAPDLQAELRPLTAAVPVDHLAQTVVKDLCFCQQSS